MNNSTSAEVKKQINRLCIKMKIRYPHLYQETGGKFIRKVLLKVLHPDAGLSGADLDFPCNVANNKRRHSRKTARQQIGRPRQVVLVRRINEQVTEGVAV
jgi:hypothetical protein